VKICYSVNGLKNDIAIFALIANKCYGWLGSPVVRELDLQLVVASSILSRDAVDIVTILGKLFTPTSLCRSQWSSGGMIDCGVRGRGKLCLSRQPLRCTALGTGCACSAYRSTQPSNLRGTVK